MSKELTKLNLMEDIRVARGKLEEGLSKIPSAQMVISGVTKGDWSIKDILIHIAIWEQRMTTWIRVSAMGKEPKMLPDGISWDNLDEWDRDTFEEHKDRTLEEARAMFNQSYVDLFKMLAQLDNDDLFNPDKYSWRKGRPLYYLVETNTSFHYIENMETIQEWIDT
ncbi:MAG: ClbS/DfsB family four-helix bundle protein [Chloroflexota bacterium]